MLVAIGALIGLVGVALFVGVGTHLGWRLAKADHKINRLLRERRPPTSRYGIVTGSEVPLLRTTRAQRRPYAESPISQTLSLGPRRYCHTPVDSRGVPAIQVV
jgi:hypothetical protein